MTTQVIRGTNVRVIYLNETFTGDTFAHTYPPRLLVESFVEDLRGMERAEESRSLMRSYLAGLGRPLRGPRMRQPVRAKGWSPGPRRPCYRAR